MNSIERSNASLVISHDGHFYPEFSGCRNNPRVTGNSSKWRSQRRALEDQIYDLQYEYDKKAVEASRLQQENASLRAELEQVKSASIEVETGVGGPALIDLSVGEQHARIEPQKQIESIHPVSHAAFTDKPQKSTSDVQSLEINKLRSVFRDADSNGLIDTIVLHITPQNQAGDYIPHADYDYVDVVIRHNDATDDSIVSYRGTGSLENCSASSQTYYGGTSIYKILDDSIGVEAIGLHRT